MSFDPQLLLAGLSLLVISFVVALVRRQLRRSRKLEAALAPRPMLAGSGIMKPSLATEVRETNGRKIIAIIHDFGHPRDFHTDERRYLSTREAFEILAEIRAVPADKPIDIVLHTPGGEAFACELIASALKDRPNTTSYVPYCAMSAGTIIALATEKIVMGKYACLGPIDTQFYGFPIESYIRLLKEKPLQNINDEVVLLGYLAEKEMKTARARACELLNKAHFGRDDACQLTDFLVAGDMPHSEQISRDRARELGVNVVNGECPVSVYNLVEDRLRIFQSMAEHEGFGPDNLKLPSNGAAPALSMLSHAPFRTQELGWRRGGAAALPMAETASPVQEAINYLVQKALEFLVNVLFSGKQPTRKQARSHESRIKSHLEANYKTYAELIQAFWDMIFDAILSRLSEDEKQA